MAASHPWVTMLSAHTKLGADATVWGGKALGLLRLQQANVTIPPTLVLSAVALQELVTASDDLIFQQINELVFPLDLRAAVEEVVGKWGSIAVRSSASWEDGAHNAAPGLFESVVPCRNVDVWSAIRQVWLSAFAPIVMQYRKLHGDVQPMMMAVIIQPVVAGEKVVAYTRSFEDREQVIIEQGGHWSTTSRLSTDNRVKLALAAEQALGCDGADVEMIVNAADNAITVVQARPLVPSALIGRAPPPAILLQQLSSDSRTWTMDIAHNPTPISVAQAELVTLVESRKAAPYSMKVCAGYLYRAAIPGGGVAFDDSVSILELKQRWTALAAQVAFEPADQSIHAAANVYITFYRLWAHQIAPLIKYARQVVRQTLQNSGLDLAAQAQWLGTVRRQTSIEHWLQQAANGAIAEQQLLAQIGHASAQWDVMVPTFAEQWPQIMAAVARLRSNPVAVAASEQLPQLLELAQLHATWAEQDDLWFFAAQAMVRKALLHIAIKRGIPSTDVFWIPWAQLQDVEIDADRLRAIAAGHSAAHARACKWLMPLQLGKHVKGEPSALPAKAVGHGPRFAGRVVKIDDVDSASMLTTSNSVIVARSLTPGLVLRIVGAAGVVCDTGGLLDHGAAMARELGVPYLVGAGSVYDRCYAGQEIIVDPQDGRCVLRH
jgi:phosphohistidine swiveling domain-containing protein